MDPILLCVVGLVAFVVLLVLGMQIGIAMILVGFVGVFLLSDWNAALGLFAIVPYKTVGSFSLAVIPLFVLMGQLAFYSGISSELFDACYKWLGRFRGGLSISTVGACALFSAICGSSTATAATMATVALPEMARYGYKKPFATGLIASAGTMGVLIPPSVAYIVYGTIANESIGALFAAGVIPGILMALIFIFIIIIFSRRDPESMPAGEAFPWREMFRSLKGSIGFLVLFIVCLGGIFGGLISPSEGGGLGAFVAFIIMIIRRRASLKNITAALIDTIKTSTMIFTIMIGAKIFGYFLAQTRMPTQLADVVLTSNMSEGVVMAIILITFIILGCFVDTLPLVLILVPIFLPIMTQFGWNPVWFGTLMVICGMIGNITPPVGVCCYVVAGVSKLKIFDVFKGAVPFVAGEVVTLLLVVFLPGITLLLPNMLY